MAFYKKQKLGKKWYPRAVTGKSPFTTDDVAARLSKISTVSRGDTYAVLANLGDVLADMLSTGQSVRLMGIGTFYLTCQSVGQGVDMPEEVSPRQITAVKVGFIPEYKRGHKGQITEQTLIAEDLEWICLEYNRMCGFRGCYLANVSLMESRIFLALAFAALRATACSMYSFAFFI